MRRKKVCFVGYGSTEYSRKSEAPVLWYYAEAIRNALKQAGLHKKEIQGFSVTTQDRKSTRLNSSHRSLSRMPSSA